ncbi:MAG: hypothetical protein ACRDD7_17570 [Peptostreptococcaceae bacterium]
MQFSQRYGKGNAYYDNFNIFDGDLLWNIYNINTLEIISRSKKSKNILLSGNKQFLFNCK